MENYILLWRDRDGATISTFSDPAAATERRPVRIFSDPDDPVARDAKELSEEELGAHLDSRDTFPLSRVPVSVAEALLGWRLGASV